MIDPLVLQGSSAGKKGKAAGSDKDASSLLDAMNDAEVID